MLPTIDSIRTIIEIQLLRHGIHTRDERGAVSTEMAIVIAVMVAVAVAAGAIFIAKAQSNANNIPDTGGI